MIWIYLTLSFMIFIETKTEQVGAWSPKYQYAVPNVELNLMSNGCDGSDEQCQVGEYCDKVCLGWMCWHHKYQCKPCPSDRKCGYKCCKETENCVEFWVSENSVKYYCEDKPKICYLDRHCDNLNEYCHMIYPSPSEPVIPIRQPGICTKLPAPKGYCWTNRECEMYSRGPGICGNNNICTNFIDS